jgi:Tfp pilus assembly protein FimT
MKPSTKTTPRSREARTREQRLAALIRLAKLSARKTKAA